MTTANDRQVAGEHYRAALQHWDLIDDYRVGYLEGCASKYVTRWRKKAGVQDLRKADHYLQKLYEARAPLGHAELVERLPRVPLYVIAEYAEQNALTGDELRILRYILHWESTQTLQRAREEIALLIANAEAAA